MSGSARDALTDACHAAGSVLGRAAIAASGAVYAVMDASGMRTGRSLPEPVGGSLEITGEDS